jgi:hypothetical protein
MRSDEGSPDVGVGLRIGSAVGHEDGEGVRDAVRRSVARHEVSKMGEALP